MDPENPYAPPEAEVVSTRTPDTDLGNAEQSRLDHLPQEATIQAFGWLAMSAFPALFGWWVLLELGHASYPAGWVMSGVIVAVHVLFAVGVSLSSLTSWARAAGTALGVLVLLPLFPLGTLMGAVLLWTLRSAKGREVLSADQVAIRERTRHVKAWPLTLVIFSALLLASAFAGALVVWLLL